MCFIPPLGRYLHTCFGFSTKTVFQYHHLRSSFVRHITVRRSVILSIKSSSKIFHLFLRMQIKINLRNEYKLKTEKRYFENFVSISQRIHFLIKKYLCWRCLNVDKHTVREKGICVGTLLFYSSFLRTTWHLRFMSVHF